MYLGFKIQTLFFCVVNAMDYIGLLYPYFIIFIILDVKGILVLWLRL
jgi:hypothetical protein